MNKSLFSALMALMLAANAWCFERVGHSAVAYIAECNLTPTAKAAVEKYLDGYSITYYASWMDNVRRTPEYSFSNPWHCTGLDASGKAKIWTERYTAQTGINEMWRQLNNRSQLSDSAVAVAIKLMVHMIGDIHCLSHSHFEDLNQKRNFSLNKTKFRFHKFLDGDIFALVHPWHYRDFQEQLDRCTPERKREIMSGTLTQWIEDNGRISRPVYDILTPDREFDEAETSALLLQLRVLQETQVRNAGYRLAHVLNSLFDPAYTPKWVP